MASDRMSTTARVLITLLCVCAIFGGLWAWYELSMLVAHNRSRSSLSKHEQQKLASRILDGAGLAPLPKDARVVSATNGRVFVTHSHRLIFRANKNTINSWLLKSNITVRNTNSQYVLDQRSSCGYEHGEITADYQKQRVIVYTADY